MALSARRRPAQHGGSVDPAGADQAPPERRISQCVVAVAGPRSSLFTTTKRKMTNLKQRIAHAVKRPRKKRGQRSHSLPARNYPVAEPDDYDDIDYCGDDFFPAVAPPLRYSCPEPPLWPSVIGSCGPSSRESSSRSFSSAPGSWSRKSVSTSGLPPLNNSHSSVAMAQHRHPPRKASSLGPSADKWDVVRRNIRASHKQPLPHAVGKLSDRKQINRKIQYVKDKWVPGGRRRLTGRQKTHYREPWWRNMLRSTINWMCPFVIVSKHGDVYCVPNL